jgi:hypothetical protein
VNVMLMKAGIKSEQKKQHAEDWTRQEQQRVGLPAIATGDCMPYTLVSGEVPYFNYLNLYLQSERWDFECIIKNSKFKTIRVP